MRSILLIIFCVLSFFSCYSSSGGKTKTGFKCSMHVQCASGICIDWGSGKLCSEPQACASEADCAGSAAPVACENVPGMGAYCIPPGQGVDCVGQCEGRQCGDDGCGGSCGDCGEGLTCDAQGICVSEGTCTPQCEGRRCGPDGCNETCGDCAQTEYCDEQGQCRAAPQECPAEGCPQGTYCDLSQNRCVVGCLSDEGCGRGTICDTAQRKCVPGCRDDSGCDQGAICENLQCRAGCRRNEDCPQGQVCRRTVCEAGCRADSDCEFGQVCNDTRCAAGCRNDGGCREGEICVSGQCRTGCRPQSSSCAEGRKCCSDTLSCEGCCADGDCAEKQICEKAGEGADAARACREGCRAHESCVFNVKPYYDDPIDVQGYCSPVTKTCYLPCWEDFSIQGSPVQCDGECITPGQLVEGGHSGTAVSACVPTFPDSGFPSCGEAAPDQDGVCSVRPACPAGTVCHKAFRGYGSEYTIYPAPYAYRICWPIDLAERRGSLAPCAYCGPQPWGSCDAGHCEEPDDDPDGEMRCVDWCGTMDNCP